MIAKLQISLEEADETLYWLDVLVQARIVDEAETAPIFRETEEILKMIVASLKTLKSKKKPPESQI